MSIQERSSGPDLIPYVSPGEAREWFERAAATSDDAGSAAALDAVFNHEWVIPTLYWTARGFDALRPLRSSLIRLVPGLRGVSIGYQDPASEFEQDGFGVILQTSVFGPGQRPSWSDSPMDLRSFFGLLDGAGYLRHRNFESLVNLFREVSVYGSRRAFSVVLREGTETNHALPQPMYGSAACYGQSRLASQPITGVLTAKHVVSASLGRSPQLGDKVRMAGGLVDHDVVDIAPDPIDAALLGCPIPTEATALPLQPYVAQWMPVTIETVNASQDTIVTAITDTYNVWDDPDIPAFLELDDPAAAGDSGSIVLDENGHAAGMYRGEFNAPYPKKTSGRAAHMRQLTALMDMELYR